MTSFDDDGPVHAVGAIVLRGDEVLVVQRAKPPLAGTWTLPGGRVEPGETVRDAVAREVREETALDVRVGELVDTVRIAGEGFDYVIHEHACELVDPLARACAASDALDARWVRVDDLDSVGATDAVRAIVLRARDLRAMARAPETKSRD